MVKMMLILFIVLDVVMDDDDDELLVEIPVTVMNMLCLCPS